MLPNPHLPNPLFHTLQPLSLSSVPGSQRSSRVLAQCMCGLQPQPTVQQQAQRARTGGGYSGAGSHINPSWLPPGNPQHIALMMEQLKSLGLFNSLCWDCLTNMDNKPAYQNLRQKVDNCGGPTSGHLDTQEWNPAMNKNQFLNGLRQSMVQSGMLEAGVDKIISQMVDTKLNHIFRPQIEQAIHKFLSSKKKEALPAAHPEPESQYPPEQSQDASCE
uniref:biorientation of chromosomes in cell division protein 1-like n=1 Tax=Arvicanthis niloticus TaxID=61156 RepID=UPI0014866653|nr:biorientation of chromosomes in cell division protein 1-like [Arvicanthis niloticus]